MRNTLILPLLVLTLIPRLLYANDTKIKNEVNAKVTQLAALMGDSYSHEYPDYRGIQILRNDKDNLMVAVSIFTIEGLEGGNNYTQFMAVFSALSTAAPRHPQRMNLLDVIAVGGKGVRGIEFKKITMTQVNGDIRIMVPALEYGPNDALCCPSIKSEAHFIVRPRVGGRIREIENPKR
jgi:hypothetical protein